MTGADQVLAGFRMSWHAARRALDMAVTIDEIRAALVRPEAVRQSPSYPGTLTRVAGRIALPVEADGTIPTVLWRRDAGDPRYDRADDVRRGSD